MLSRFVAALAAMSSVIAISAAEPVLADGVPASTSRPAAKAVKYNARHHVAYAYVRDTWPGGPDPYAYSYERVSYYPAYNSNQWVPRRQMLGRSRYPLRIPEYYSSWGYPLGCKVHGRRNCGVPVTSAAGDPRHYYRRDVQLENGSHQR